MMMCKRGDIYMATLSKDEEGGGSLQQGVRPVLIISNDKCNEHSSVITVVPFTSRRKNPLPTHVLVKKCGLTSPSLVLAEQIMSLNKSRLKEKLGSISETEYVKKVDRAIKVQLGM